MRIRTCSEHQTCVSGDKEIIINWSVNLVVLLLAFNDLHQQLVGDVKSLQTIEVKCINFYRKC